MDEGGLVNGRIATKWTPVNNLKAYSLGWVERERWLGAATQPALPGVPATSENDRYRGYSASKQIDGASG